jgi:UDP:flavonoid glycosyltransferase YjiC (YdhE family)
MTRIIIAATPAYGHVAPLRPIAADLVRRGEQATFLTASAFRESIEETGARFVALPGAVPDERSTRSVPLPEWWPEVEAAERVVVVTQGTIANLDFTELIEPALEALADLDVLVVATHGRDAELADVPANARVAEFIPFAELLPHASVLVSNGGYGGVQQALRSGVPMVLAGQSEDKVEVTARTAWAGAAVDLATQRPAAADIREAVQRVLGTPAFRERAEYLGTQYSKHDALAEIHASIGELIAQRAA